MVVGEILVTTFAGVHVGKYERIARVSCVAGALVQYYRCVKSVAKYVRRRIEGR